MSMWMFWVIAALLLLGGMLLVLPALLSPRREVAGQAGGANVAVYRDQLQEAERDLAADVISPERFEQLKGEIERRVLEDTSAAETGRAVRAAPARRTALALLILLPLASVSTYLMLGQPDALQVAKMPDTAANPAGAHEVSNDQILRMVSSLAEKLKADPGNAEGWQMLARTYLALERYDDATAAFAKAAALLPGSADVLADLADAKGMAQGRSLAGEPAALVQRALKIDPRHPKALALAGSVAFEARDYAGAKRYWEQLLAVLPPDNEMVQSVKGGIAEATQLAGGAVAPAPGALPATAQAGPAAASSGTARITGEVTLAPELAAKVAPTDTLFIYARAAQGPKMPLAIVRQAAGGFPIRFTLDDSQAMSPASRLSGFPKVEVVARVSRSGTAAAQAGDLIGQVGPVDNSAQGLKVKIDRVQP